MAALDATADTFDDGPDGFDTSFATSCSPGDSRTETGSVQVSVRVRPPNPAELAAEEEGDAGGGLCLLFNGDAPNTLSVKPNGRHPEPYDFGFDHVFGPATTQDEVRAPPPVRIKRQWGTGNTCVWRALWPRCRLISNVVWVTAVAMVGLWGRCRDIARPAVVRYPGDCMGSIRLCVCVCVCVCVCACVCVAVCVSGSGKTYTMAGTKGDEGIIPRMNRSPPPSPCLT